MPPQLKVLEGKAVSRAIYVHDYFQLHFEQGEMLNINNNFTLSGPMVEDVAAVEGKRLLSATETKQAAILRFEDGSIVEVDLRNDAFNAPEAMELNVHGHPTVIWN